MARISSNRDGISPRRTYDRLVLLVRDFDACDRGNVAIIFCAALIPMLLSLGGAVDFGRAYNYRTMIGSAADAAALAGARDANEYLAANGTGSSQQTQAQAIADASARKFLVAKLASFQMAGKPAITIGTQIAGRQATVNVSVHGTMPTQLLSIAGIRQLPFSATSKATMKPATDTYYQILFVVDVSNSMGIGGTATDIAALENNPSIKCAFACHDPYSYSKATEPCGGGVTGYTWSFVNGWYQYVPIRQPSCDKRALARGANIKLKIDYVNTAVNNFVSKLISLNNGSASSGHYFIGLYTFGTYFNTLLTPTNNLVQAQNAAAGIDVEAAATSGANYGYTYTTSSIAQLLTSISKVGDGSSIQKMKTYVIFISDGVEDMPGSSQWGRRADLDYLTACSQLKNKGLTIFSIWAGYNPIQNDSQYNTLVSPISKNIASTMQNCASSSSQYFVASDGPAIQTAVDNTFVSISAGTNLRLTQ